MIEVACPGCGAKLSVPEEQAGKTGQCRACGAAVTVPAPAPPAPGEERALAEDPAPAPPPLPPPPPPAPPPYQAYPYPQQPAAPSALDSLIPTKNPSALIAYYLGVFSLIPCVGLLLAIPALILGLKGVRFAREHPEAHGKAHAWVGVIMGALFTLIWGGLLIMALISAAMKP